VREWLRAEKDPKQCKDGKVRRYDLIFVDPPTFSNSKSMGKLTWDIQRDHFYLLRDISKLLRNNGVIIFSGNLRSFKLDEKVRSELGFDVLDITAKTIPEDFARNKKIHFCYILQQRATHARTTA
jgi:23S rRNA (guanine2445-N2)-methyltransferase / 23S rRNA (guanine2069-N7)-methyltransferase